MRIIGESINVYEINVITTNNSKGSNSLPDYFINDEFLIYIYNKENRSEYDWN